MAKEIYIASNESVSSSNATRNAENLRQAGERILRVYRSRLLFDGYDDNWKKAYFNSKNGGFNVYHSSHQFSPNKPSKEYMTGGEAEKYVGKMLTDKYGKKIEYLPENGKGTGKPDLKFDGHTWDVKYIPTSNENTIRKYIEEARKAERVIFYWDGKNNQLGKLKSATERTLGKFAKKGKADTLPSVYYMTKDGTLRNLMLVR